MAKHERTLEGVFAEPTRDDLVWTEVVGMLEHRGATITAGRGSRVRLVLNGVRAERGEEPDRPFSGQFNVRMAPELHRAISLRAVQEGKSLNAWITSLLRSTIHPTGGSAAIETGARLTRAKKSKKRVVSK